LDFSNGLDFYPGFFLWEDLPAPGEDFSLVLT